MTLGRRQQQQQKPRDTHNVSLAATFNIQRSIESAKPEGTQIRSARVEPETGGPAERADRKTDRRTDGRTWKPE